MSPNLVISLDRITAYRSISYRTQPSLRLGTSKDAVDFVNERGFIFFWPITGINMPSLWCAAAGDRPVPNNHDDPGHITWRWKDELLGKNKWYYAKVLRRKSTIISLKSIPYFFALSPTIHQDASDLDYLYKLGILSIEEKLVFELLSNRGPLDTISIRESIKRSFSGTGSRVNRAMELLQRDFRIVPVGISNTGRWNYAYIYDIVQESFPKLLQQSKHIAEDDARKALLGSYFLSTGIGTVNEIYKIFRWEKKLIAKCINCLMEEKALVNATLENGQKVYSLSELI